MDEKDYEILRLKEEVCCLKHDIAKLTEQVYRRLGDNEMAERYRRFALGWYENWQSLTKKPTNVTK